MSVYTNLSQQDVAAILAGYNLGGLLGFSGIAAGIENSNFFVDTERGRFVLTIFERMNTEELPYFMHLMCHLSANGFPCPAVQAGHNGSLLFDYRGKKGCLVSCLPGRTLDELDLKQLESAGHVLGELHLKGLDFPERRANPTFLEWITVTGNSLLQEVRDRYGSDAAGLLEDELAWQRQAAAGSLPSGVIHADYFCDNILFVGDEVSGVIDFYYACDGFFAYDLAIAANALAIRAGCGDSHRIEALLRGYEKARGLTAAEKEAFPGLLRLAALRFWVSRLYDAFHPREGSMVRIKEPEEYRNKLLFWRGFRFE
jgi:homoserine kinase type II